MENSLKGVLTTATIILIFITCILSFIILFPTGQGVVFNDAQSRDAYLNISHNLDIGTESNLQNLSNSSNYGFNNWDITQGYMGSNSMAHGQTGVISSVTQVFTGLKFIATLLFTSQVNGKTQLSPVLYVIGVLGVLAGIIMIYFIYKFVRTGL